MTHVLSTVSAILIFIFHYQLLHAKFYRLNEGGSRFKPPIYINKLFLLFVEKKIILKISENLFTPFCITNCIYFALFIISIELDHIFRVLRH